MKRTVSLIQLIQSLTIANLVALSFALSPLPAEACTILSAPHLKDHLVGKSYDWVFEDGLVMVNKRHMQKKALLLDPTSTGAVWTSKFGSITFNQYGREFPLGGINEAGLVVEIAWLEAAKFPKADKRPTLNELQWVQYQLDQYATVRDVAAHLEDIRIARAHAPVHYLVCDASRDCLTVEFLNGKLVTHTGSKLDVQVLANDPYAAQRKALKSLQGFGGRRPLPEGTDSFARYARAAVFAHATPDSTESDTQTGLLRLFQVLASVHQNDYSKWHISYETHEGIVSWRSSSRPLIKSVKLADFDFSCHSPVKVQPVVSEGEGSISASFEDYTTEANRRMLDISLKPIANTLPPGTLDLVAEYPETLSCAD